LTGGRDDSYLALLQGTNHFSIADPFDSTTGRSFLDFPSTQPEEELRELAAEAFGLFINAHVRYQSTARETLNQWLISVHPLIASFDERVVTESNL